MIDERDAYEKWSLNGNRFMTDPYSIFKAGMQAAKSSEQPDEMSLDDEISLERSIAAEIASYYVGGKPEEYLKVACGVRILLQQRGLLKRV